MTREIILDTETTGFEPDDGHRIVELGCVELVNHLPTGRNLHIYFNPMRDVPADAVRVHGLTTEFLKDKPLFSEKVGEFLEFIGDATLVIHNAEFDIKFLNAELKMAGFKPLLMSRVTDTLLMARAKYPGQPASLDALCRRFKVDDSGRTLHGALLDSQLLAEVYLELIGGRQHGLSLDAGEQAQAQATKLRRKNRPVREARDFPPSADELKAHESLIDKIKGALWRTG